MRSFVSAVCAVLLLAACSTDFALEAPFRDIPVVYGFLSSQDTAHYVRVEKAFLDQGGDATQVAQIADSLYYDPNRVQVTLEVNSNGDLIEMERVDGNTEGYVREDGPFATAPNYLYKADAAAVDLDGGEQVTIRVVRDGLPATENTAQATTIMLRPIEPRETSPPDEMRLGDYNINSSIRWTAGDAAKIFTISFLITITEQAPGGGNPTTRTLRWEIVRNQPVESTSSQSVVLQGESFYQFLGSTLEADGTVRTLNDITIEYAGAGQEIVEYFRIANANVGITSSQNVPVYSNVEGGLGIFTSRYYAYRSGLGLDGRGRDSLRNSIYTRELNFQ